MPEFIDRLRGQRLISPPTRFLSGQLFVRGPLSLDRDPTEREEAVVVDAGEPGVVVHVAGQPAAAIEILQGADPVSLRATTEIAEQLAEFRTLTDRWHELAESVEPVVSTRQIGELLDRAPLEAVLSERMPDLRQVFFEPEAELQFERLRVPVGRARRISRKASQTLAERSEDWLRMSASGVVPHRIESLTRHEVIDIYENRVAARLADAIRLYLVQRLRLLDGLDELVRHEVVGWWRRQDRLTTLWGATFTDDAMKDRVERRRRELEELLGEVERLRDGRLYRGVPLRARVAQPIRLTNLLSDDPHYRQVGALWREWWRSRGQEETPRDRRARREGESDAFYDFTRLLVWRSLLGLGDPTGAGESVSGPWGTIDLVADDLPGCWNLHGTTPTGPAWQTRIVALPAELVGTSDNESQAMLELAIEATEGQAVIVLYAGTGSDVRKLSDAARSTAYLLPLDRHGERRWLIPISPLDLEAQDRVDLAIRSITLTQSFMSYPATTGFPSSHHKLLRDVPWIKPAAERNAVVLEAPPRPDELNGLRRDIEATARREETRLAGAGRHDAETLRVCSQRIAELASTYRCFTTCPICGNNAQFEPREARTFECRCPSCGTRWGLRHEASDDARIPYMFVDDDGSTDLVEPARWFGRDMVSLPCRSRLREYGAGVIDPQSGRCTEADSIAVHECDRCTSLGVVRVNS